MTLWGDVGRGEEGWKEGIALYFSHDLEYKDSSFQTQEATLRYLLSTMTYPQ